MPRAQITPTVAASTAGDKRQLQLAARRRDRLVDPDALRARAARAARPTPGTTSAGAADREQCEQPRGADDRVGRAAGHPGPFRLTASSSDCSMIAVIAAGPMITTNRQGRIQKMRGTMILTGTCWALRLGVLTAFDAHLGRLHAEHLSDGDAEGIGLHHRSDERLQVVDVGRAPRDLAHPSLRPIPSCISRSTRANSSASGPSVLRATCWSAASNPRPCLDADGEQVDRIGQGLLDRLGALRRRTGRGRCRARRNRPRSADADQ